MFVELAKMKMPKAIPVGGNRVEYQYTELPKVGGRFQVRPTIAFLDSFEQPILYYRANPRATRMAACG